MSDEPATDRASLEPPARAARSTPILICVLTLLIGVRAYYAASPATEAGLGWILGVIATWGVCLIVIVTRNPGHQLRLSDPGVLILLWAAYYFILPAINWLSGSTFALEGTVVSLTSELVTDVEQMHVLFLIAFTTAYVLVLPRSAVRALAEEELEKLPKPRWWILVGLSPVFIEVIIRLVSTGTIRPEVSYLDAISNIQENVDSARSAGGSEYVLTQVLTKLHFYGSMVLGFGLSLYLVRAWRRKQWWRILLFHAAFPVLLYLSVGARSTVAFPFMIALIVTDQLAGPISWKYLVSIAFAGFAFFYVYGFFRMYQDEDLGSALADAMAEFGESRELDVAEAENSLMLMKEAYAVQTTQQSGADGIAKDLLGAVLLPIPQQLTGEKDPTVSDRLSRDLIGDRLFDEGFALAGSLLAEGYLAEGPIGVTIIALILGVLIAGSARLLLGAGRRKGAELWKIMLLAALTSQAVLFIRSELGILIAYYIYYVAIPLGIAYLLLRRATDSSRAHWNYLIMQLPS